MDSVTSW